MLTVPQRRKINSINNNRSQTQATPKPPNWCDPRSKRAQVVVSELIIYILISYSYFTVSMITNTIILTAYTIYTACHLYTVSKKTIMRHIARKCEPILITLSLSHS